MISNVVEIAGGQFESVAELKSARRQLDTPKGHDLVIIGTSAESPLTPDQVRTLRSTTEAPLIVMAESYDEAKKTLEVYKAGADQVLPKPFVPDALVGAIKSAIRQPRPESVVSLASRIELGPVTFDAERRVVSGPEANVHFTKREWQLLAFFLAGPNKFFKTPEVSSRAWGSDASTDQLRGYIARLRKKLTTFSGYFRLVTEKAKGYALVVDDTAKKRGR